MIAQPYDNTVYCRGNTPESPTCCNYQQDLMIREDVGSILPDACYKQENDPFKGLLKDFACMACGVQPSYVIMQTAAQKTAQDPVPFIQTQRQSDQQAEADALAAQASTETDTAPVEGRLL